MDSVYDRHQSFYGEPYLLTPEQLENPVFVLHGFFDFMHLHSIRKLLEQIKETVILSTRGDLTSVGEREDAIYFLQRLEEVVEAAFVLTRNDLPNGPKQK